MQNQFDSAITSALSASKQASLALYVVTMHIARKITMHTAYGEQLVKPAGSTWSDSYAATIGMQNCTKRTLLHNICYQIF